ncbi:RNA polymerase sigma factor SigI [Aquibacillus salsiterrae]|uniref:RNA polymerase sigma factor SigI n=1 Tax=Aquibacillus salsiterrae TaxID=2950439 RepID=A0A9X4AH08_9BACI|nr:RNA polymerase sigma factor SigI [Aquibacillus salsiterrae]MDC3417683.1 RNA polymerase sigma factor SigI [Aquibacillus salsiterrae]
MIKLLNRQLDDGGLPIEQQVLMVQHGDIELQNQLLKAYQPFVAKTVSEVCKRYISQTKDDEFSIGLFAFNEAMGSYSADKGSSFLSFARLVIKRKVIDFIRKESNKPVVASLDVYSEEDQMENPAEVKLSKTLYQQETDEWNRREEIAELSIKLQEYKLTFEELTCISPKHADARESAIRIARMICDDEELKSYVLKKKKVPIKKLVPLVDVSKKTLERNRKYILAMFIVLSEDYVYLKDYLKGVGQ